VEFRAPEAGFFVDVSQSISFHLYFLKRLRHKRMLPSKDGDSRLYLIGVIPDRRRREIVNNHRSPVPHLEPGTLYADRYRIVTPIGRGGMGQVYLAEDIRLGGKRRAVKLTASPAEERESFIREARILSELQHPHLPDIVDYYPPEHSGTAGMVMEYIAGDTLSDLLERSGRSLPYARVYRYLVQLCDVLCYLHGRQPMIIFRDLKPANVLIDRHDRAVLIDFGIARPYRPGADSDTERLGTPAFAAPEQIRGEQTDARTDLYGWGALAYYLLSGGQFAIRRTGSVRQSLQPDVPNTFAELLESVLADDSSQRPQNAVQLLQSFRQSSPQPEAAFNMAVIRSEPDPYHSSNPSVDGVQIAAILSAYPGAGATFASIGLSKALRLAGAAHALVECPGGEPELFALLDGTRRMPKHAAFADPSGQADALPSWRDGAAAYYPLDSRGGSSAAPDAAFALWLRRLGMPLVLLDVSSSWDRPGMVDWIAGHAGSIWWVADCLPAKWSVRRQEAGAVLQEAAKRRGISSGWIANRDFRFPQREQWLSCFPQTPITTIPQFSTEAVVSAAWRGEGIPSDSNSPPIAGRAFQNWARLVIESQGSYHLFHR
jgi:hypothetical protein